MARKNLGDAFGGRSPPWKNNALSGSMPYTRTPSWEGPTFEIPVALIGCEAVSRFMEFLLSVVPRFAQRP